MDVADAVLKGIEKELLVESPKLSEHLYKNLRLDGDDVCDFIASMLKQLDVESPPDAECEAYHKQVNPDERWTVAWLVALIQWCVDYHEQHPTHRDEVRAAAAKRDTRARRILWKIGAGAFMGLVGLLLVLCLYGIPVTFCIILLVMIVGSVAMSYIFPVKRK